MYGTYIGGRAESKRKKVFSTEHLYGNYNFPLSYTIANYLKSKHIDHINFSRFFSP